MISFLSSAITTGLGILCLSIAIFFAFGSGVEASKQPRNDRICAVAMILCAVFSIVSILLLLVRS